MAVGNDVKFAKRTLEQFNKIETKDNDTIYFITDTKQIYLGDTEYIVADQMSNQADNILTGSIDAINGKITVGNPTENDDATPKSYVDSKATTWDVIE